VWGQEGLNINAANAQTLLGFVCGQSFAQPPELCTDPTQMQAFIMGVTLGKSMTFGMPLFGSAQNFVDMMAGKGPLGTVLTTLQVKPVTFKSTKDVSSAIALKSRRFSIYADGIVPGYKRTTKVRIHAVLDFRFAGALGPAGTVVIGGGQAAAAAATMAANTPTTGTGSTASASTGSPSSPDDILKQLNSNPAGTVIYWRVE